MDKQGPSISRAAALDIMNQYLGSLQLTRLIVLITAIPCLIPSILCMYAPFDP